MSFSMDQSDDGHKAAVINSYYDANSQYYECTKEINIIVIPVPRLQRDI